MRYFKNNLTKKGQGLVELALFLPVFLTLLGGIVEVSQLVITQNRLTSATRAAARFGALGGEDDGMISVVKNAVTNTLIISEDQWDIWIIRGTVNEAGDNFSNWQFSHAYGYSNTVSAAAVDEAAIKQRILGDLHTDHQGTPLNDTAVAKLEFVGAYAIHEVNSILGLDAFSILQDIYAVDELIIMRQNDRVEQSNGCSAFPIAVHEGIRSVTPEGTGSNPYPSASDFSYPALPPALCIIYSTPAGCSLSTSTGRNPIQGSTRVWSREFWVAALESRPTPKCANLS